MPSEPALLDLQTRLVAAWNRGNAPPRSSPALGMAVAQALEAPDPPRPGFAVGIVTAPDGAEQGLEIRVDPTDEADRALAQRLAEEARSQGVRVNLELVPVPMVPTGRGAVAVGQDAHAGRYVPALIGGRCIPPHIGCSIGHYDGAAGTVSAFVRLSDGGRGVISCCHVLARGGAAKPGDEIHHPGYPDEDPLDANSRIGKLAKFTIFHHGGDNLDFAVATLGEVGTVNNRLPTLDLVPAEYRGRQLGPLLRTRELAFGDVVAKIGRSTGYQTGRVTSLAVVNQAVRFDGPRPGPYYFEMMEIEWSDAASGDSGALVFRLSDLRPVAVHCAAVSAGGRHKGYAIALERIPPKWGVTLLLESGVRSWYANGVAKLSSAFRWCMIKLGLQTSAPQGMRAH